MKALLTAGVAGLLFALGLGLAGMTDPARVVGFLDVAGRWDPSLAFVMAGALGTYALARRVVLRRARPLLAPAFPAPGPRELDARLLTGAALFGVGWGLSGYCPGPAVASLAVGGRTVALFVAAMVSGMALFRAWERRRAARLAVSPVLLEQ
jgi:uncharacterized membrane protein YedE/YeeE